MKHGLAVKLGKVLGDNAFMLPTKLLIFLQTNSRFSAFDGINFFYTFLMFTYGINQLLFALERGNVHEDINFFSGGIPTILMFIGRFIVSQIGVIIVAFTLMGFFTFNGVPLDENYVQQNYD